MFDFRQFTDALKNPARLAEFSPLNWRRALEMPSALQPAVEVNNSTAYVDLRSLTLSAGTWLVSCVIAWSGPAGAGARIRATSSSGVTGATRSEDIGSSAAKEIFTTATTTWMAEKTSTEDSGMFSIQSILTLSQKTNLLVQVSQRVATSGNSAVFARESELFARRAN